MVPEGDVLGSGVISTVHLQAFPSYQIETAKY